MPHDLLDLAPGHATPIEPHPEPAARANVGGQVEARRVEPRTVDVLAARRFHAHGYDAVAVVVVKEIGEYLAAHAVNHVIAFALVLGAGKGLADRRHARAFGILRHGVGELRAGRQSTLHEAALTYSLRQ